MAPLLSPVLADRDPTDRIARALAADPALGRRARWDGRAVVLTGPDGTPPPASSKERRRWELHVHHRVAADAPETPEPVEIVWLSC